LGDFKTFNKQRLLDYLSMYKSNNTMKMKVLSTLSEEQLLTKLNDDSLVA